MSVAGTEVVLGLGSNVEPEINLPRAVAGLAGVVEIVRLSRVYESDPVGAPGSPRFLNAALVARTGATAAQLKHDLLRPLESRLGRRRSPDPNAPREIDLDILLFGDRVVSDPARHLEIPDPALAWAAHVLLPAAEVAPDAVHPRLGVSLGRLAARIARPPDMRLRDDLDLTASLGNNAP
ncbi:MAG: 2-amino-4-hydroxy-6-hydroxymethyldihydropteridine diphosphokinase [Thermoanaerobaculia bacterium]